MKRIRVFQIARQLRIDTQKVIDAAAEIGIILKNSALSSVSPDEYAAIIKVLEGHTKGRNGKRLS